MKLTKNILFVIFTMILSVFIFGCQNGNVNKTPTPSDEYEVSFVDDNNKVFKTLTVKANESLSSTYPEESKEMYEIIYYEYGKMVDSWYTDKSLTTKYDFSTLVNEDITLYPKYSIDKDKIFLENLYFELSKDKDYYIVTGTKYFEIYSINEMNGKLTRDENVESTFNIIIIPVLYNGLPIKEIKSLEVKQVITFNYADYEITNTYEGSTERSIYTIHAEFSQIETLGEELIEGFAPVYALLPSTLKTMGGSFQYCEYAVVKFPYGSTLEDMGGAFSGSHAVLIEIPDSVLYAFGAFTSVPLNSYVTFPENTTRENIPEGMFYEAIIETIEIPSSVKVIESQAFVHSQIQEIKFGSNSKLTSIKENAFDMASIDKITLPSTLVVPEYNIFENVEYIDELYFEGSLSIWKDYIEEHNLNNKIAHIYTKENGEFKLVE